MWKTLAIDVALLAITSVLVAEVQMSEELVLFVLTWLSVLIL